MTDVGGLVFAFLGGTMFGAGVPYVILWTVIRRERKRRAKVLAEGVTV